MSENVKTAKRIILAPSTTAPLSAGEVLSVEAGPDEDVEWIWSHHRERGSTVTGYKIVTRETDS